MGNGYWTISLPTSVGEPDNKWSLSLYLVCITGIFGLVKILIVPLKHATSIHRLPATGEITRTILQVKIICIFFC